MGTLLRGARTPAGLSPLLFVAVAAAGCHFVPPTGQLFGGPATPAERAPAPKPTSLALDWPVDESGPPKPDEVGVVVCEPIANGAASDQAAFGAGCTRWLQFVVGGQGELAQTPTWTSLDRARREIRADDLRLGLDQTAELTRKTGATHCLVGEIRGSAATGLLTLAIAQPDGRKLLGKPLTLRGSRDEILRQLPAAARQIAGRLGVAAPTVPAAVEGTADDLRFLGSVDWLPPRDLPEPSKKRLDALARKVPYAALLALSCSELLDRPHCESLASDMVRAAPDNTAAFGGLAYLFWHGCVTQSAVLDALRSRYPNNYQLAAAQIMRVRGVNPIAERDAAAALTRSAPRNPDAWLSAGYTLSTVGGDLRQGRFAADISPTEFSSLDRIYADWLADVKKATELDPQYAHAWARLATAATFAGDNWLADKALWTALKLDPAEKDALDWGLQMYQPKWTNDPDKLLKVARMDADAHHWDSSVFNIARELEAGGQPLAARRMRAEGLKRERAEAAAHPHDFVALAQYAWGLKGGERYGEAEAALRNLVKSFPRESALQDNYHEALATCLVEQKKTRDAIAEYQAAVKTHPRSAFILRELGYAYRQNHEPLKAIDVFHKAMRLDHGNANSWALLGDACLDARLPNQAIPAYQRSLQLDSRNAIAWRNLSKVFGLAGRYAEGIAAAQKALELDATDSETHGSLGYLYGQTKQPDRAAEECRLAVQYKPEDAISHNNLGEALRDLHQTAEARKEWELALRLDPNGPVGKNAREMLAKYP